jgi:hypothetical protein
MSGILSVDRTTHHQLKSPKAESKTVDEINPYIALVDSHDSMNLSLQASINEPAKHGKMKRFWHKAMDLFSPTSLMAVQIANNKSLQKHLSTIDTLQQPLNSYLAMRRQYNIQPSLIPDKAPAELLEAYKHCKDLHKQLEAHISMLTSANKRHQVSFDAQLEALGITAQQSSQHLQFFQTELETFFPKKKESALDHNLLMLMDPTSIELLQVNTDLEKTKVALVSPNLKL